VTTPTIRTFLDLSTKYLPRRFFQDGCNLTAHYPTEYGMLLWVPDSPDDPGNHGVDEDDDDGAPEVIAVRRYARALGCDYILFDQDGGDANLPVYDWAELAEDVP